MKIGFEHQTLITSACDSLSLEISDYCFANIFLFRNVHQYELHEVGKNQYALIGRSYEGSRFFMPLYHPTDWKNALALAQKYEASYIYPIPEGWWGECPGDLLKASEGDSDYILPTEAIRTYHGRRYDGHRHNVRAFLEGGAISVKTLQEASIADARSVVEQWNHIHGSQDATNDVDACLEALDNWKRLCLDGYLFYVDNSPEGLVLGQALRSNMYVLHFAKAISKASGSYQYMYQYLAERLPLQYELLNLEQDLGIPGLREAKKSFHPSMMLKKGRLYVPYADRKRTVK